MRSLNADFEANATTTELSIATDDNILVDLIDRVYRVQVLGDGQLRGPDEEDEDYTPGSPSMASVALTDNDGLQVVTVHPNETYLVRGGTPGPKFEFRRTGDTSRALLITYSLLRRAATVAADILVSTDNFVQRNEAILFPAGVTTATTANLLHLPGDIALYPYSFTTQIFGDGGPSGGHQLWEAGDPNTATIVVDKSGSQANRISLRADYENAGHVGNTITVDFEVKNTGTAATGETMTISGVQRVPGDRSITKPNEPRVACTITGSLAADAMQTCSVTITLTEQDKTDSPMVLDITATDGTTTSNKFTTYITVLGAITVGFDPATRLRINEPVFGEANAQAVLTVRRDGPLDSPLSVSYTLSPVVRSDRSYPAKLDVDYEDNSATPGTITFAANAAEQTIIIDISGDDVEEPVNELFRVRLDPSGDASARSDQRSRTVAIVDHVPAGALWKPTAKLQLLSADPTPEGAGTVFVIILMDREWGRDARFTVALDSENNLTATPASSENGSTWDFRIPSGSVDATFTADQTWFIFTIDLYDDDIREEDETFQLRLSGANTASEDLVIMFEDTLLVTIADDDFIEPTQIDLSQTHRGNLFETLAEDAPRREITVTASFPEIRWPSDAADAPLRPAEPRDVDTTVRVTFDDDASSASLEDLRRFRTQDSQGNYQNADHLDVVIAAGQTSGQATLRLTPTNDGLDEDDETVIFGGTVLESDDINENLTVNPVSFTLTDDDTRGITVGPSTVATNNAISMNEGATFTYTLVLDSQTHG